VLCFRLRTLGFKRSTRPIWRSARSNAPVEVLTRGARIWVLAERRNAAATNRRSHEAEPVKNPDSNDRGPSKAASCFQNPNSSPGEGTGSINSAAMCPALP